MKNKQFNGESQTYLDPDYIKDEMAIVDLENTITADMAKKLEENKKLELLMDGINEPAIQEILNK